MAGYDRKRLAKLIRKDRVHRSVYTDPEIFESEMARIFAHSWVYVGHESQISEPGDFLTEMIGLQPVVMVRHTDGKVHVLYNRCGHRGAVVENLPKGNAKHFRCCYHGWVFKTDGELASVPLKNGYPENFDLADPMLGMVRLAKVESYRGFVFACMDDGAPEFATHMGGVLGSIDDLCDRAPGGEIALRGGVQKYMYRGNWKIQLENLNDLYHPPYSHESFLKMKHPGTDADESAVVGGGGGPSRDSIWDQLGVWAFARGHSYCGKPPGSVREDDPVYKDYKARMVKAHGGARAAEILSANRHNTVFYPNFCIQSPAHIRVIKPVSVDCTQVWVYPVHLVGASDEMNRHTVRFLNVDQCAAALHHTDDLESFKRCQEGFAAQGSDWVMFARGLGEDRRGAEGVRIGAGTDELTMRNQFDAWLGYMNRG